MFINFWYAAALSSEVGTEKPKRVKMLGQRFVLFRDSAGVARCVSDICVHRGASLAGGKVKGDSVECPYHGWKFDGSGRCTWIPSLGKDARPPARAKVDGYPTQERYGLVFAFLGDLPEAERPPLMEIPEWGRDGWRCINLEYRWTANWERSIEAGLDPAHAEFVHTGMKFAGADEEYAIPSNLEVRKEPWGTTMEAKLRTVALPARQELGNADISSVKPKASFTTAISSFHGPTCTITRIRFAPGQEVCQYMWETPEDEFHVAKHLVSVRSIVTDPMFDDSFNKRNLFVADEDKGVVEEVDPMVFPDTMTKEVFVPADAQIAVYRQYIKDWEAKGWRIDSRRVEADKGRVAYCIPSPERRTAGNWAIDAVPLVGVAAGRAKAATG
jgi:phenylpropionate dioxygenase-like ring-hydroxylating dioxygenase large terminal subunit